MARSEEDRMVSGEAVKATWRPVPAIGVKVGPVYVAATLLSFLSLISMFRFEVALA